MDRLLAKDAIRETMYRIAYAEDEVNKDAMLKHFHPTKPFIFDMSQQVPGMEPMEITREHFWQLVEKSNEGFTGRQYVLSNMIIDLKDEALTTAHVKCQVIAYHCMGKDGELESVTSRDLWLVDLELWEATWICRKVVVHRDVPLDRPGLYEAARVRMEGA